NGIGPLVVTGFTSTYYMQTTSGTQVLALTPTTDILTVDSNAATAVPDVGVTIPYSVDGSDAANFLISGLNEAYAGANKQILANIYAKKVLGVANAQVKYQIIVDYTGGLSSSNLNSAPAGDTVFGISATNTNAGSYNLLPGP